MRWSFQIAKVAGIPIRVHGTFLLLVLLIAGLSRSDGFAAVVWNVTAVVALFTCVVLHELGHSLAARRFGIAVRDITLLPIGGVAQLERMPENPRQEILVALAGPVVNVVLAGGLTLLLVLWPRLATWGSSPLYGAHFIPGLRTVNLFLLAFNLLPAFPMDGGRVLRGLLAHRLSYVRATRLAATIGQGMAILFGFWGLASLGVPLPRWMLDLVQIPPSPLLLLIGLFVYQGAGAEAHTVEVLETLRHLTVRRVMAPAVKTLSPDDPLKLAVEHFLHGLQDDLPILSADQLVGILYKTDVLAAVRHHDLTVPVVRLMRTHFTPVSPEEKLHDVYLLMREYGCSSLPVVQAGRLMGMVTLEHVGRVLQFRRAWEQGPVA